QGMLQGLYRCLLICCFAVLATSNNEVDSERRKSIEYKLSEIFNRNDGGMFDEQSADTVVARHPNDVIEVNGYHVFFLEMSPPLKVFSCKNYRAMNLGQTVEVCDTFLSRRCVMDLRRVREFRKTIMFPDGNQPLTLDLICGLGTRCCEMGCCKNDLVEWFQISYKLLLIAAPFLILLLFLRVWIGRDEAPPPRKLPSQERRLEMYREELEEQLRKCHRVLEGRR
ncbi:hypothetical protein PENTCL1PPCAC_10443, partial [Pristionchus entomophagus]